MSGKSKRRNRGSGRGDQANRDNQNAGVPPRSRASPPRNTRRGGQKNGFDGKNSLPIRVKDSGQRQQETLTHTPHQAAPKQNSYPPPASYASQSNYAPPSQSHYPPPPTNYHTPPPARPTSYDYLLPSSENAPPPPPPAWLAPPIPQPTSSSYHPPPPPSYSAPPPPSSGAPSYDEFRPPTSDFNFRAPKPAGVQESYDSYRPEERRRDRDNERRPRPQDRPDQRRTQNGGRRGGQGPGGRFNGPPGSRPFWRPFQPAERALLSGGGSKAPERAYFDANAGQTFRSLDDYDDDEEADMDFSSNEDGDGAQPSQKRARLSLGASTTEDNAPKWSNPDPYTAMAGIDPSALQKKKDVVQMIRKARVQTSDARAPANADTEDFISCDFASDDEGGEDSRQQPPRQAPVAPAAMAANHRLPPRPSVASNDTTVASSSAQHRRELPSSWRNTDQSSQDQGNSQATPSKSALGTRKRTHDDEIKLPAHAQLKKFNKRPVNGGLAKEWKIRQGQNSCPWIVQDHSTCATPGVWLHKEICDFYDHIKPCDFEDELRQNLVQELKDFTRKMFGNAEVYPFGSFSSGLYLPTGDMDLVLVNDSLMNGRGFPKYNAKKQLWQLANTLRRFGLCRDGEVEVIAKARVPLVKYIDKSTGLKVDMSFENLTGIQAIKTFQAWKEQYPAMPVLVTLIKQFLLMRGLNEPVNGGLGGFSVICLVVSMLQHMPEVQSRNMNTLHHLGELLMSFFDLYGNKFNYLTTAISLNPPKYIPKNQVQGMTYRDTSRLSIIDPNNSANDISGGSSNIGTIVELFADAYERLAERMAELPHLPRKDREFASILDVVFGGNYSTFHEQREHMRKLAERNRPKDEGRSRR